MTYENQDAQLYSVNFMCSLQKIRDGMSKPFWG